MKELKELVKDKLFTIEQMNMWKYEQEFRIDKPETVGEKDKRFDLDNYKDWLEEQLTDCRKQLSIQRVVGRSEQLVAFLEFVEGYKMLEVDLEYEEIVRRFLGN